MAKLHWQRVMPRSERTTYRWPLLLTTQPSTLIPLGLNYTIIDDFSLWRLSGIYRLCLEQFTKITNSVTMWSIFLIFILHTVTVFNPCLNSLGRRWEVGARLLHAGGQCLHHCLLHHRPQQLWERLRVANPVASYPASWKHSHHPCGKQKWLSTLSRGGGGRWVHSCDAYRSHTCIIARWCCVKLVLWGQAMVSHNPDLPWQRVGLARWCSTASSSKPLPPSTTTFTSSSRASWGRFDWGETAKRWTNAGVPSTSEKRASPKRPDASWIGLWRRTTRRWPWRSAQNPAMTSRFCESTSAQVVSTLIYWTLDHLLRYGWWLRQREFVCKIHPLF